MKHSLNQKRAAEKILRNARYVGECLECALEPNAKGYCYASIGGRDGKRVRVNRLMYEHYHGPLPDEALVLHTCDNRRCIAEEHLYVGSAQQNTDDMMTRGRNRNQYPRLPL